MLSVLVAAFDPASMGLGVEVEALSQLLLKHRSGFNQIFQYVPSKIVFQFIFTTVPVV